VWELQADSIYFGPLAVAADAQRRGIAKKLIREVEKIGISHGKTHMKISVVNHRTDIIPMYEKMGFVKTGESAFPDLERITRQCHFFDMARQIGKL
jgi:ribosomal protein S18 acetylase RimI-like enzyme